VCVCVCVCVCATGYVRADGNNPAGGSWFPCSGRALLPRRVRSLPDLMNMSADDQRNTLIVEVGRVCSDGVPALQKLATDDLAGGLIASFLLARAHVVAKADLPSLPLDNQRNTLIAANQQHLGGEISTYQALSTYSNARLGYSWYLPRSLASFMNSFEAVVTQNPSFATVSSNGQSMDCLSVQHINGKYLGVYHHQSGNDIFDLYVAESDDLVNWVTLKPTLSQQAEGTPNLLAVEGKTAQRT